jgi:TRAP-type C4-dicarboxylate transport system permease small subunit
MQGLVNWLRARADNVAVALLTVIFLSFILQIVSRYIIRQPLGWTLELCLLCWLWLVFWSSAFTLRDEDHVRFTILWDHSSKRMRRIFAIFTALCIIAAFGASLPATYGFVSFMAIEKTSLLKVRFDIVFAIFLLFAVAMIAHYAGRIIKIMRGRDEDFIG